MEKPPGKSSQRTTSGSKSSNGNRGSRSRERPPGVGEIPPGGLVSCDPSSTNQMLQSWYNYSMYNMFLNAVANQAAVADMMNRSQMQLMPDLTSPKQPATSQKKPTPVPVTQSSSSLRNSTSRANPSSAQNTAASSASTKLAKPVPPKKDVPSLPTTMTTSSRHLQRNQQSSSQYRDTNSTKDAPSRHSVPTPYSPSRIGSVTSKNLTPAHCKKDSSKLIDDLVHKAYGKSSTPQTKPVVPAHSKKEITSVPDRTRDSYQHAFRPRTYTSQQVTDPTSDIPKSNIMNKGTEAVAVLDLSKSRSVTSSSNSYPPEPKPDVSQASCVSPKESCSSSIFLARRPDRKNSKGILSKRPRIMDNPYLMQKVCAASVRSVPSNPPMSSFANESSKLLKLESTEVSSMIDRLFESVGEPNDALKSKHDVQLQKAEERGTSPAPMEVDNPCNEVTSSESPPPKLTVDKALADTTRGGSPKEETIVSSFDAPPMELSTQCSHSEEQTEPTTKAAGEIETFKDPAETVVRQPEDGEKSDPCTRSISHGTEPDASDLSLKSDLPTFEKASINKTTAMNEDCRDTCASGKPTSTDFMDDGDTEKSESSNLLLSKTPETKRENEEPMKISSEPSRSIPENIERRVNEAGDLKTDSPKTVQLEHPTNLSAYLDTETGLFKTESPTPKSLAQEEPCLNAPNIGDKPEASVEPVGSKPSELESKVNDDVKTEIESKPDSLDYRNTYDFSDDIEGCADPYFGKTWNFRERKYENDKSKKGGNDGTSNNEKCTESKITSSDSKCSDGEKGAIPSELDGGVTIKQEDSKAKDNVRSKPEPVHFLFDAQNSGKTLSDSEDTSSLPSCSYSTSSRGRGAPRGRKGKRGRKKGSGATGQSHLCKKCGLAFPGENELEIHKRSHLGQKLFVCEYCHKSFVRGYYYKLHVSLHEVNETPSSPKPGGDDQMDLSDGKESLSSGEDSQGEEESFDDSASFKYEHEEKLIPEVNKLDNGMEIDDENASIKEEKPEVKSSSVEVQTPALEEKRVIDAVDCTSNKTSEIKTEPDDINNSDSISPKITSIASLSETKPVPEQEKHAQLPGPSHVSESNMSPPKNIAGPSHTFESNISPLNKAKSPAPSQPFESSLSPKINAKPPRTPSPARRPVKSASQPADPLPGPSNVKRESVSPAFHRASQSSGIVSPPNVRNSDSVKKSNGVRDAFLGAPVRDENSGLKISSVVSLPRESEYRFSGVSSQQSNLKPTNSGISTFGNYNSNSSFLSSPKGSSSGFKREFLDDLSGADSLSRASILASAGLTVDTNITGNYANSTMVTATPETDFSLILNTDPVPCTPSDFIFPDDEMFSNSPKEYLDLDTTTRARVSELDPMKLLHVDNMIKIEPNNDQVVLNIKVETEMHFGVVDPEGNVQFDSDVIKKEEPVEEIKGSAPCSPLMDLEFKALNTLEENSEASTDGDSMFRSSLSIKSLVKGSRKGIKKPRKAKFVHRFKCKQCPKDFARYGDLKKHESQHTGDNLHICEVCGKVFLRRCFYLIHLKRHQSGKYVHQQCGLKFPSATAMKTHMRFCNTYKYCGKKGDTHFTLMKNGNKSSGLQKGSSLCNSERSDIENSENSMEQFQYDFIKPENNNVVTDEMDLKFSMKKKSRIGLETDENGEYTCDVCGKKYMWLSALVYHKHTHTGAKPYKCPQCDKTFRAAGTLRIHIRYHNNERPYICEKCGKGYTEKGTLKSHMKTHTGERKYKCEYCAKTFAWREHMRYHLKTHTGEKPHQCLECGKRFVDSGSLKVHMRSHSDERPYACGICEMRYKSSKQLLIHRRVHTGETPYSCTHCSMKFRALCNLKRHLMTHTKEKPLKCKFCPKMFRSHSNLKEHINIHTGKKPHVCKLCDKKFANSGSLAKHIATHSDEKPFECDLCKKCFRDKGDLKSHMRSHSDERPFSCPVCGQRFKHKCHITKHMRTHTRNR